MSLNTNLLGMDLKTPFLVASGPWLSEGGRIMKGLKGLKDYWGGVVTKTYMKEASHAVSPHLWCPPEFWGVGMQNAGPKMTNPTLEELKELKESCKQAHDIGLVIIGSIMGRSLSEWDELAEKVQGVGVDALELNLSCPARQGDFVKHRTGYFLSQNPDLAAEATQAAKKVASVPIIVKLSPNVTDIVEIARACKEANADGLSAINTVSGFIGIDVETAIPYSSDIANRAYISGLSGPMIRPIGLRAVSDISSNVDLPVIGIGGVDGWKSAVEYIMVGATAVQVCTAFMWKGYKLGRMLYKGLSEFMERKGYKSTNEFRGISLQYITTVTEKTRVLAFIDKDKCNGCKACETACCESSYGAVRVKNKLAVINQALCIGCGLCKVVCNRNAVNYIAV
jgi:dihydropyrimidine dehydrogenase (NAD+) subunit PreA